MGDEVGDCLLVRLLFIRGGVGVGYGRVWGIPSWIGPHKTVKRHRDALMPPYCLRSAFFDPAGNFSSTSQMFLT